MDTTIIDCLRSHARTRGAAPAFRFIGDLAQEPEVLTFAGLLSEAEAVAQFLAERAAPGDRVMLFFPPGLAYIKAFLGCLLAGMVAVPLYPPRRNVKSDRIVKVAHSCQATVALTTASELQVVQSCWDEQNEAGLPLALHATDGITRSAHAFAAPELAMQAPAFLQYTSGSTGTPKGVIITHENIIANMHHLSLMSTGNQDDVFVNWLPLFHDLGLVTAVLWPVHLGAPSVLMAPATFVRDPLAWFKAITRYRGTMCGAPNFAFDLCVDKISDADLAGIDLSSWRVAYNAAEPIRAATLAAFGQRFAAVGFREHTWYPSYGMAEATVFITGGRADAKPIVLTVDKKELGEHRLVPVADSDPLATQLVFCGAAHAPHDVKVVDPDSGAALPDGQVGEVWFAGPSVSPGYWQLPELSASCFGQRIAGDSSAWRYLRTGDLGVMRDGELCITGRIKDLVILHGRNYYPQDLELSAAAAHRAVRAGHVAAFAMAAPGAAERLVVVAELEREHFRSADPAEVAAAVRARIALDHEVTADEVVLLRPYKIPMTSSGKIQRRQTRQMLEDGELDVIGAVPAGSFVAPATPTEQALAAIWCQVLKRARIGTADNFFDIGGNSLAAMDISARVSKHFAPVELDVSQMLDFPNIGQMASWIDLRVAHAHSRADAPAPAALQTITL